MIYAFEAYTLDTDRYELRHAGRVCPLEPQALEILAYLLAHRDRVVSKQELLERLWPNRFVGEGILAQRVMTIRKAVGDSGRSQQRVKTVHGRGYRFVADVSVGINAGAAHVAAAAGPTNPSDHLADLAAALPEDPLHVGEALRRLFSPPQNFVGRDAELTRLGQWWSAARDGVRQLGFVVGEPGIGKSALVDTFVAQIISAGDSVVGRGQCVDDYGIGEPYLPVLEALDRLCRGGESSRFIAALRRHAPSWLAHLPSQYGSADVDAQSRASLGVTPRQMLRELTDALEVLTQARPLLLVFEDVHWSDRATLAWLAYLVRRRDPARLLILATYRPGELLDHAHPLRAMVSELQTHQQCVELVVEALPPTAVADYLSRRCAITLPVTAPALIHRRSGGHPLFLAAIVDELVREWLLKITANDVASLDPAAIGTMIPSTLQQYIEQHLQRLSNEDQMLLEAASIAGSTFTVAAVAAAVPLAPDVIETRYTAFARQSRFIRISGSETWPDGTLTACYAFKHALYCDVVYARVSAGQRRRWHQQIGARKEAGYGARAPEIAAELAAHFIRGGAAARGITHLHHAAATALRRSAYDTAITHLAQGLELLRSLPDQAECAKHELKFLTTLGLALVATKGQAHLEVESTFVRARELCHQLDDRPQLFLVLGGLFSFYTVRAKLQDAWDVGQQLSVLAERQCDPPLRVVTHWALGQTRLFKGEVVPARVHLERGIALYDPHAHRALGLRAGFPGDLGVFCRCFAAHTLWHLGYPDQALRHIREALEFATALAHPFSRALALAYAAMLYQFLHEPALTQEAAETAMTLCQEQGFPYYLAWATIMRGWAFAAQGMRDQGMVEMREGLAAIRATGAQLRQPYYLGLLAEAYAEGDDAELGLRLLEEGLTRALRQGECWHEAELHRLRGELSVRAGIDAARSRTNADGEGPDQTAEQCFHQALVTARRQEAKSLELRAAVTLARLWHQRGDDERARALLAPVYAWFTEGLGTVDLRAARALLDAIG